VIKNKIEYAVSTRKTIVEYDTNKKHRNDKSTLKMTRTIQHDSHTIHMENPAVITNIIVMLTSLLSIILRLYANATHTNPTTVNTA